MNIANRQSEKSINANKQINLNIRIKKIVLKLSENLEQFMIDFFERTTQFQKTGSMDTCLILLENLNTKIDFR